MNSFLIRSPKLSRFSHDILGFKFNYNDRFGLIRQLTTVSSKQNIAKIEKDFFCVQEIRKCRQIEVTFDDAKEAFKSKSNFELIRALIVFKLCGFDVFVRHNQILLNSMQKLLGKKLFKKFAKATFYGHFLAGENFQEVIVTASNLSRFGVESMLNYTVESEVGESGDGDHDKRCDQNVEFISNSIDAAASAMKKQGHKGFAAVKLTAIGQPELLEKLSGKILQIQNSFNAKNSNKYLKYDVESMLKKEDETYATFDNINGFCFKHLSVEEITESQKLMCEFDKQMIRRLKILHKFIRLNKLANYAANKGVRLMIDAEQSYLQPAISKICIALMQKYNKKDVVVMNTYQAYLKQTPKNLFVDLQMSKRYNFHFGCKLVRGAYMEHERERAKEFGYEDPVNDSYEATTQSYHTCLEEIVQARLSRGLGAVMVMVASHNEDTVRHTLKLMDTCGIDPNEQTIYFGQLYGMCDQITFPLGEAGYNIYKCLHYGPLEAVLPYLSRRAKENGSLLKNTAKERVLLWAELKRRITNGLVY